jgi:hypothetical protein
MRNRAAFLSILGVCAGCAAPGIGPEFRGPPPLLEEEARPGPDSPRGAEGTAEDRRDRGPTSEYAVSAWIERTDIDSDSPAGRNGAYGASLGWSRIEEGPGSGELRTRGFLAEFRQARTYRGDPSDPENTRVRSAGAWYRSGIIRGARTNQAGDLEGWDLRFDTLLGLRYHFLEEADDDVFVNPLLFTDFDHAHAVEFSLGVRAEYSPVRRLVLFGRAEGGIMPLLVYNEASLGVAAGVRLEPVPRAGIEFGWRSFTAEAGTLFGRVVRVRHDGPWIGVTAYF